MAEQQDLRLTYFYKYTENTSTCGTIHTENLLKTNKRPQDYDRTRKTSQNQIGKKKEEKEGKESEMRPATLGGSWKEEKLLHPGKFPTSVAKKEKCHQNSGICPTAREQSLESPWQRVVQQKQLLALQATGNSPESYLVAGGVAGVTCATEAIL